MLEVQKGEAGGNEEREASRAERRPEMIYSNHLPEWRERRGCPRQQRIWLHVAAACREADAKLSMKGAFAASARAPVDIRIDQPGVLGNGAREGQIADNRSLATKDPRCA